MSSTGREIMGWGLVVGFVGTIIYAIKVTDNLRRVERKLDKSIDEIVYSEKIDIPQATVNKAIEKHVDSEVRYQIEKAATSAAREVVGEFKKEIRQSVREEFQKQKADVANEMRRQVKNVDISEIKREVVREAAEEAKNKFRKDLDEILDKHNEQLEDMTRIYSSIAERIENIGS